MRAALIVVGFLAGVGVALLAVFTLGFRSKFPPLHDAIRRFNRDVTNPRQLQGAGQSGAWASVIRHVGRNSGKDYRTPVVALPTDDGFVFALPYGPSADWVRNVLVAGSATIEHDGHSIPADRPELLRAAEINDVFSARERRMHRIYGVDDALLLRRTDQP